MLREATSQKKEFQFQSLGNMSLSEIEREAGRNADLESDLGTDRS